MSYDSCINSLKKFVPVIVTRGLMRGGGGVGRGLICGVIQALEKRWAYMWSHTSVREKVGLSMGEAFTRGPYKWRIRYFD